MMPDYDNYGGVVTQVARNGCRRDAISLSSARDGQKVGVKADFVNPQASDTGVIGVTSKGQSTGTGSASA